MKPIKRIFQAVNALRHETGEASVSIGAALSGSGTELDTKHRAQINRVQKGRNYQSIKAYSIPSARSSQDHSGIVLQMSQGASVLAQTMAPQEKSYVDKDGLKQTYYENEPAYVQLFSETPSLLERLLTEENPKPLTPEEFAQIWVVGARFQNQILVPSIDPGEAPSLNFSWVSDGARNYRDKIITLAKDHGTFHKDEAHVWRAGSSIYWANKRKYDNGFDVRYYSNPRFAKDGLFLNEDLLNNRFIRGFLNAFSVRVNKDPIEEKNLDRFVHQSFMKSINLKIRGKETYLQNKPDTFIKKIRLNTKIKMLRPIQKVANFSSKQSIQNIKKSLLFTGVASGLMYSMGWGLQFLGFFATSALGNAKAGAVMRTVTNGVRRVASLISPEEATKSDTRAVDISHLFADEKAIEINDTLDILPLSSKYDASELRIAPANIMRDTFKTAPPYTEKVKRDRANNVLLDTCGGGLGTMILNNETDNKHGRAYLEAVHPDGIVTDHYIGHKAAYATLRTEAHSMHNLDQTFINIFEEVTAEGHQYRAIVHIGDGDLYTQNFTDEKDFPTDLFEFNSPNTTLEFIRADEFPTKNVYRKLPESLKKKSIDSKLPKIKKLFREMNDTPLPPQMIKIAATSSFQRSYNITVLGDDISGPIITEYYASPPARDLHFVK